MRPTWVSDNLHTRLQESEYERATTRCLSRGRRDFSSATQLGHVLSRSVRRGWNRAPSSFVSRGPKPVRADPRVSEDPANASKAPRERRGGAGCPAQPAPRDPGPTAEEPARVASGRGS